jgi:AraC family L-rhamnose operon regulatory protein RhaS
MAKACGLGRSRFAHYCRRVVGLSPTEHLTRLRIEAAGRLLRSDPRRKISEVARLCGFGSSQYFATVFRFHTGRRPRSFQNAEEAQSG